MFVLRQAQIFKEVFKTEMASAQTWGCLVILMMTKSSDQLKYIPIL
jgi:hypothetical protein